MPNLDDIVQKVAIDGTGEIGSSFEEMASVGEAAFKRISEAAEGTAGGLSLFSTGALAVVAALAALTVAAVKFVDAQAETIVKLDDLGRAFGTTASGMLAIEGAFKQAGVASQQIERGLNRLINQSSESAAAFERDSRTATIAEEGAAERIVAAQIHIEEAKNNAANSGTEWALKLQSDSQAIQGAFVKLQFAASDMASTINNDLLSVESASNGVERAQLNLEKARNPGGDFKQREADLKIKEAEQAVASAQQRESDAVLKQTKDLAQPSPVAKAQTELDQANFKFTKDLEGAFLAPQKAANQLAEAFTGLKTAVEHQRDQANTDVNKISRALSGQGSGAALDEASRGKLTEAIAGLAKQNFPAAAEKSLPDAILQELHKIATSGQLSDARLQELISRLGFGVRGGGAAEAVQAFKQSDFAQIQKDAEKENAVPKDVVEGAHAQIVALGRNSEALEKLTIALGGKALAGGGPQEATSGLGSFFGFLTQLLGQVGATGPVGHAEGGPVKGPGSGTSDSIPGWLSHGEFVQRAAAVSHYGEAFMHSINNMTFPAFAAGGPVGPSAIRFASGGSVSKTGSVVNLHIGGEQFELNAPDHTASKLQRFAIGQRTSATGKKPSWVS